MTDLYEVLLVDGATTWHTGVLIGEEDDTLLRNGAKVLAWGSRAGLEHHASLTGVELSDELPDELDLDLGGWLPRGTPEPPLQDVSELWHLLLDDPRCARPLTGELIEEAYDDLVDEVPDWFSRHSGAARVALTKAVRVLRSDLPRS